MDIKKYVEVNNKHWQDNLGLTVKNYSDNQLQIQIESQQDRIANNIFCKVATKTKVKKLLAELLEEQKIRKEKN